MTDGSALGCLHNLHSIQLHPRSDTDGSAEENATLGDNIERLETLLKPRVFEEARQTIEDLCFRWSPPEPVVEKDPFYAFSKVPAEAGRVIPFTATATPVPREFDFVFKAGPTDSAMPNYAPPEAEYDSVFDLTQKLVNLTL